MSSAGATQKKDREQVMETLTDAFEDRAGATAARKKSACSSRQRSGRVRRGQDAGVRVHWLRERDGGQL
jgi:hypothetical protein